MADLSFPSSSTRRGRVQDSGNVCPTLMAGQQDLCYIEPNKINVIGNYSPSNNDASRIADVNGIAPTVKENHGTVTGIKQDFRIRKLTPLECWRLMGFTDEQFHKAAEVNSNSQLYKQAGNSIVVDVLYWLFYQLFINKCEHPVTEELDQLQGQMTIFDYIGE